MHRIPRDNSFDSTLALLREPYDFVSERRRRFGSDVFQARLLLRKTICMTGPEAAKLFYDPRRFIRHGAMPEPIRKTLLGQGGVQGLDDQEHRHRKEMFVSLMTPESIGRLGDLVADHWRAQAHRWASMGRVVLYPELHPILTRAVCTWGGVPLAETEVARRTRELVALFDAAGGVGARHLWSRLARRRAERWIEGIVEQVRAGQLSPPKQSPLHVIATHRDVNGALLPARMAAVEVLNLLRPTVAVSVFMTFAAHALHLHSECRQRLAQDEDGSADLFVQEVRRFYPFFPAVMARVREDFDWNGYRFPRGRSVMLDLYGTNHDPRTWDRPEAFRPERFRQWDKSPFNFIPQGGGEHRVTHRCPGEWITIELMKVALSFLAGGMAYDVPEQDLRIDRTRLPALPRSRFIMCNVRLRGDPDDERGGR
ncbi:cytochrome P450 [Microvirga sp. VF16]|uniref:cytochrome P450 n=1 Tax=Microvirga sp. VF16 TaxID=2807101 RepID=UPI00193C99D0|nr:cytochrome P450 [Microvirga sp. VF16]QRM35266.1 cytochrome P450 [Microvirga sp. VF16]